jgi:protein-glutamine gamma-glutamyltransferase
MQIEMTPALSISARPTGLDRIHACLEVSLFLMTLTAFTTLAATGGLDKAAAVLVFLALLLRGWLLGTRRSLLASEQATTLLTIACAAFYAADFFLLRANFLSATVRLVLFVMVVRIYSARRDRDYYFLAIIAFLMLLAAAVMTVDSAFLFGFALFLLAAAATFILMEMKHAAQQGDSTVHPGEISAKRLAPALGATAVTLVLGTLAFGGAIFFLLPRASAGYLSAYTPASEIATGFSDSVQLGRIGEIQQSRTPVMHIQIEGDRNGTAQVKWQGVTLSNFDGKTWSHSREQRILGANEGGFALWPSASVSRRQLLHYRVLMEPVGNNIFFLAPVPQTLKGDYRVIAVDGGEGVSNLDGAHAIGWYQATSDIAMASADQLRKAGELYPPVLASRYLQLPRLDPRIGPLAHEITRSSSNNYDRAMLLEAYLRIHYRYTLQLSRHVPEDPLAEFLFDRKQGHCEYFASSMAVMLRVLGIPARVANGFQTGEFNDVSAEYIVRASDAHSWVEAYFPGQGWISFDPTPANSASGHTRWSRALLYLDALHEFWREWVVNYDTGHQTHLALNAQTVGEKLLHSVRAWYESRYRRLLELTRGMDRNVGNAPVRWAIYALLAVAALATLFYARRIWKFAVQFRIAARPETAPKHAASVWYRRMLKRLARRGLRKSPEQTPQEFVSAIPSEALRGKVEELTRRYEGARFGGSAIDAAKLPILYEEVRKLARRTPETLEKEHEAAACK